MARTITYDKEPVTRFNEIFHDTTTKTTNGSSSSGAYSLSFASTTDFTVATEDFPGDLVSGTNIQKGSSEPNKDKVGIISDADIEKIAIIKMDDLNANSVDQAKAMIKGTAKSMGIEVKG